MADPVERAETKAPMQRTARVLRPAAFQLDDAALVESILNGEDRGRETLYDRHAPHVRRVLVRCLGTQRDVADHLQDVFEQAFRDLGKLRDPKALKAWLTRIAVHLARAQIRRNSRRRWLRLLPPDELPEQIAPVASREVSDALRATYRILEQLGADERIAFALRFIEGMLLEEVAAAAGCSLATAKRRIRRAEAAFVEVARSTPSLQPWLKGGSRWD